MGKATREKCILIDRRCSGRILIVSSGFGLVRDPG
jgi:hypothetical protein